MTAYTTLKPVTRSKFIADLGADNLPLVQFAFGLVVGFIMQGYSTIVDRLPRRWALPITLGRLGGDAGRLSGSGSRPARNWASTGFYFFGLILGILVISQFWTLANEHLRPAAGEADLRVHRRRLEPRRHRRLVADDCRPRRSAPRTCCS